MLSFKRVGVVSALCATLVCPVARGAEETDISAQFHGSVAFLYQGDFSAAVLREQGIDVGQLNRKVGTFDTRVRFGLAPGVELWLGLPVQVSGSMEFSNISPMVPCSGDEVSPDGCLYGTSAGTTLVVGVDVYGNPAWAANPADPTAVGPTYSIHGARDLMVGLRYAPFSEKNLGRKDRKPGQLKPMATWVLDAALAIPVGDSWYERQDGTQGAANGAIGAQLHTAVSTRLPHAEPYVSVTWRINPAYDLYLDPTSLEAVEVDPANKLEVFTGVELVPYEELRMDSRFGVDVAMAYQMEGAGKWPSGVYLPSILTEGDNATAGQVVPIDERIALGGRLQLHYHIFRYVSAHVGGDLYYFLPQRVEHPYSVRYGRDLATGVNMGLTGHF